MIIPENICNLLEATQIELEGTKDLIAFLCRDSLVQKENLDYYKAQYDELYLQFELIKQEITEQWNNGNSNWILDYSSRELTSNKGESCHEK